MHFFLLLWVDSSRLAESDIVPIFIPNLTDQLNLFGIWGFGAVYHQIPH